MSAKNLEIMIIDDELEICRLVADILQDEGYKVRTASTSLAALSSLAERCPALLLLDIWLEGSEIDGLGILEIVRRKYPELPVVMISGHGNIEIAVNSIKMGAYDFIEKPFKEERLLMAVSRALENARLKKENAELKGKIVREDSLIGKSGGIASIASSIEKHAKAKSRVFISGPSGSGKKHVAKLFHYNSTRKDEPLVFFAPASIPVDKMEEELFGAPVSVGLSSPASKIGLFEKAQGGTLVIDEVTDIPVAMQARLVKVLTAQSFDKPGTGKPFEMDCRIISLTCRNIEQEIQAGKFNSDFYYRLNVVPVSVPPLSDRKEDISSLCEHFLKIYSQTTGKPEKRMSGEAISMMQSYEWPGNVRQLRSMVEWLLIMSQNDGGDVINITTLASDVFSAAPSVYKPLDPETNQDIMSMPLREARELFEKQYLLGQVNRFGGNISKTSHFIGMERSALHRKLKSLKVTDIRTDGKEQEQEQAETAE